MNIWKLIFDNRDKGISVSILAKAESYEIAESLAYDIAKDKNWILKSIQQFWIDREVSSFGKRERRDR